MNSDRGENPRLETRIAAIYAAEPVPADAIHRRMLAALSPTTVRTSRRSRFFIELAATVAFCVVFAGVIAVPRLIQLRSPGGVARPPAVGATPSPASDTCTLPVAILREGNSNLDLFLHVSGSRAVPVLASASGEAYAVGLGAWVPVDPADVSPDGSQYAYANVTPSGSALHVVTHHQDRLVVPSAAAIQTLGFVNQLTLAYNAFDSGGQWSTWLLDTATLQTRIASSEHVYQWAGGGALWRIGPAAEGSGIVLHRLDLGTDTETLWFDVDGYLSAHGPAPSASGEAAAQTQQDLHHSVGILGFDSSGHPIVQLGSAGPSALSAALLLVGPDVVDTLVPPGANGPGHLDAESASAGGSDVWLIDPNGQVAVYEEHHPLVVIAHLSVPAGGRAQAAGPCE